MLILSRLLVQLFLFCVAVISGLVDDGEPESASITQLQTPARKSCFRKKKTVTFAAKDVYI